MSSKVPNPIPDITFGLYLIPPERAKQVVLTALSVGYRSFDSASFYGNEREVGEAFEEWIAAPANSRSSLHIMSKVWNDDLVQGDEAVLNSFEASLSLLKCDYFDVFLIHWPVPGHHIQAYKCLANHVVPGRARSLGVSNYSPDDFTALISSLPPDLPKPVLNQFEINPFVYRPAWIEFFQEKNVKVLGFKPLTRGKEMANEQVLTAADACKCEPANVLINYVLSKNCGVIVKSENATRMESNMKLVCAWEFATLDSLTTAEELENRRLREEATKNQYI
ncbi:hypothetical protein TrLO_g10684 [Triparma laevis f. longispina]|uniref:NADP-dependent oxidoreductase domain-containing protein n=1 Tax=Triparma laevis f. longispina TaxID=1714387 RepID=A0A9W7FF41_9STRA|nr:hypothetical protein TrLO_g10684 [Triparma laevis f. longispina]